MAKFGDRKLIANNMSGQVLLWLNYFFFFLGATGLLDLS
jgi:hypothetical protein